MAKVSDVIDGAEATEQLATPQLPDRAAKDTGTSRERNAAAVDEALTNAENGVVEDDATPTGDPTAEEIRSEVGTAAEGLTDVELLAEWKKAQDEPAKPIELDVPMFDVAGNKVSDLTKVSVADLLSGKVQFGYTAMGKEQRKALKDVLRTASNGHYNEHKYTTATSERDQIRTKYQAIETEHKAWAADRVIWDKVLAAANAGNVAPLQELLTKYNEAIGTLPEAPAAGATDNTAELDGQRYYYDTIVPEGNRIAEQYGAKAEEVNQAALFLMQQEGEFLTPQKIENILKYEVPALLEKHGYNANGTPAKADPVSTELETLRKENQSLKATKTNERTAALRAKMRKAPPAGGGHTAGAGESMPDFKNRQEMKEWISK